MQTLSKEDIKSFCDIIADEHGSAKPKLQSWIDIYSGDSTSNVDFGLLAGIAQGSSKKAEIENWIASATNQSTPTIEAPEEQEEEFDDEPEENPEEPIEEMPVEKPKRKRKKI